MAETTVKVDAVEAARSVVVRVRTVRIRELRARLWIATRLMSLAAMIGAFRIEYVDQLPTPRCDRRREAAAVRRFSEIGKRRGSSQQTPPG